MKHLCAIVMLLGLYTAQAQAPPQYYSSADGLTGTPLQNALHQIIKQHVTLSYNSLHMHFQKTDKRDDSTVWDMYSDIPGANPPYIYHFVTDDQCGSFSFEGDCYNREHAWPKLWFNDLTPMYTDLFHIFPTDGYVNGKRGNYPYGEVSSATWTSLNGSRLGLCSYPGYDGMVFEPLDEYKGDFARAFLYMSIRYFGEDSGWSGSVQCEGAQLKPWALNMMKQWHIADPVSEKEIERNNVIYTLQYNRNPLIDNPAYVAAIWGDPVNVDNMQFNRNIKVYPVPVVDYCMINHYGYYDSYHLTITMSDVAGRQYRVDYSVNDALIKINASHLKPGFYLLTITEPGKKPAFARLVK